MIKDSRLEKISEELRMFTKKCRADMHEPDEQGITAEVVGTKLDNAFGCTITVAGIVNGYQELVVLLRSEDRLEPMRINLADLIALARLAK